MATDSYPSWTPTDVADRARLYQGEQSAVYRRLAFDERMREVWEWLNNNVRQNLAYKKRTNSLTFAVFVRSATRMPGKPGDMPPKKRAQYFESVRHHAEALINLLGDTRFDCAWDTARKIDREQAGAKEEIGEWVLEVQRIVNESDYQGDDMTVAYGATCDGLYKLPYDYPHSHVIEILEMVCAWTRKDDYWGRLQDVSSGTILQTGLRARVIRFNCKLYEQLASVGVEIPFRILATVANVALDLPPERQMDEDAVRKQVRRHLDRKGHGGSRPA